jgi:hypothetical protein
LVYVMNENGHVVNAIEQEHTVALVLILPRKIIGYVACTDASQLGGDAPLCNNKDVAYATCQLLIMSNVVLLMVRS